MRAKGFCYNCDDKFMLGHKCKRLFLLEIIPDGADEEDMSGKEYEEELKISLSALQGKVSADTMKFLGIVKDQHIIVLIDTESTHNFVSAEVVKCLKLQVIPVLKLRVKVASGLQITSQGSITLNLQLQTHKFQVECHVIGLNDYDLVLGTT